MTSEGAGIHHLFEAQAAQNPGNVAIVAGSRRIAYGELNARADALARRLLTRGVKPGTLVGLLADRSVEMVIGILGIFKAGAALVPLNTDYPLERLAFIAKDAGLALVVAAPNFASLAAKIDVPRLDFPAPDEPPDASPEVTSAPDGLAYVIYTSGSTGQPKGVGLPHAGLINLMMFSRAQLRIGPGDRVLQFASFSFDASLWEIFAALVSGATLVLGTSAELMPGPSLHTLMRTQGVTIALLSPSVLQILPSHGLDALRILIAGTEKLTGAIVSRWKSHQRRFFNAYGPTEATIYQLIWEATDAPPPDNPPIGTPTPGMSVYLLGDDLEPVDDGETGELCLAGPGVGSGYINRPALTREKFITRPLGPSGGAVRIYRTGDRARRLPDGNYEYLGRLDLQVKVRGFRVEPGEIEVALQQHPGVDSSAVVAAVDGSGQMRLWGYFIAARTPAPTVAELKTFLAARLPEYMIPSGFSVLTRWPLNENGKLDRSQLAVPGANAAAVRDDTRPLSASEERLLAWCREILGHEDLGPDDSLLDAGFHSLAFAQLAWRIQDAFASAPSFAEMFARASVAELASWIDAHGASSPAPQDRVATGARPERPPLSSAQERVWFLERLHPGNNAYRFQSILKFHGRTEVSALERALNELVKRHEILRTTFPELGGLPFQKIHPYEPFALPVENASAATAQAEIDHCVRQPFDLDRLPLVRWRLFRLGPEEHWLLHTEHHLLHDGWSYGVFLQELFTAYDAFVAGREPDLPALPVQFADLAAWQRRKLDRGAWDAQLEYWQSTLRDAAAPPRLPSDTAPSTTPTFAGDQIRHAIDPGLYADLLAACRREQVTPYMWLHAAFETFLHRYTGESDIIVGTGVVNRRTSESQRLIGMMINTVAMRTDFAADPAFRDVLARFRRTAAAAIDNQDVPYDKVIQRLKPGVELFNCFFDSYDQSFPAYRSEHVRVEAVEGITNGKCKFDLTALVIPGKRAPILLWEYATELFTRAAAERMMRHFLALVAASVARPDLPVSRLPILSAEEREHLLRFGRGRDSALPGDRIERIFADRAAASPSAEALVCGDERLSYADLDRRAEELADRLRKEGVVPGGVVAISLPRGSGAIIAMLAILKCGCAYMALDPSLPAARRGALLRAASAMAMVTDQGITPLNHASRPIATPATDAYVMFTSGSTGLPKAVFAPHRGVIRLVCDVDYVRLDTSTRFLQLAPLSFDASTLEIWGPLLHGGTVVVHTDDLPALTDLAGVIRTHEVTTAWFTAALFNRIVDTAPEILRPLREVLTGGEALSVRHVARALAALPSTTITNGYGPTEATTFATTFRVPRTLAPSAQSVPIGKPIPRTQAYVLDVHREIQPIGVAGEIYLGGDGLGRFADAAQEPPVFVADPFASRPGQRLYRTGDRARLLADGNLDFIARIDRQVKIHGYRIEPGEIEAVLRRHPEVLDAAVLAIADSAGDPRLVAYLVLTPPAPANVVDAVREFASLWLPAYMVPSSFVAVPELPLSAHGKLDEAALQQIAAAVRPVRRDVQGAPRTPLEAVVAGVWGPVLGIETPGVDDNFFDVGGHSLLALRLIHELNVALGLELPVRLILTDPTIARIAQAIEKVLATRHGSASRYEPLVPLENPTVAGLASLIDNAQPDGSHRSLVLIKPGGSKEPLFFTPGGDGTGALLVYAGVARFLGGEQPFYGLKARGGDNSAAAHDTVEEMAADYLSEVRQVQPRGPYFFAGECVGGVIAYEMARQVLAAGEEMGLLVLLDSRPPRLASRARHGLRIFSSRARRLLDRRLGGVEDASGRAGSRLRRWIDERLPYDAREAPPGIENAWIAYQRTLLRYRPAPYGGRMALILSEQYANRDVAGEWRRLVAGGVDVRGAPGDHDSYIRQRAPETAKILEACLAEARARP